MMGTRRGPAVLLAMAVIALLGWWLLRERERYGPPTVGAPSAATAPIPVAEPSPASPPPGPPAPRPPAEAPPDAGAFVRVSARQPGLRIRVLLADGSPAAKGHALFVREDGSLVAQGNPRGVNDEGGEPGTLELDAEGAGRLVVFSPDHAPWMGEPLTLGPGDRPSVEVRLEPGLFVEGIVLAQDGATPADSVEVTGSQDPPVQGMTAGSNRQSVRTGEDGRFLLEGFLRGPVRLRADPGHRSEAGGPEGATVEAGDRGVKIVLSPRSIVEFLVVDAATRKAPVTQWMEIHRFVDGEEKGWFSQSWTRPPGPVEPAEPKPTGNFAMSSRETERFRVVAEGYLPSEVVEAAPAMGQVRIQVRVEIWPDPAGQSVATFRIQSADGTPVELVGVTRMIGNGGWSGTLRKVEDGRVEVEVPAGRSVLMVGSYPHGSQDGSVPWLPERVDLNLARGERREMDLVLRRGGFLRVSGPQDFSFPSGTVRTAEGPSPVRFHGAWDQETRRLQYLAGPLPPGACFFQVKVGGETRDLSAEIRAGDTTEVVVPSPGGE